jgi:hypothetical protein
MQELITFNLALFFKRDYLITQEIKAEDQRRPPACRSHLVLSTADAPYISADPALHAAIV